MKIIHILYIDLIINFLSRVWVGIFSLNYRNQMKPSKICVCACEPDLPGFVAREIWPLCISNDWFPMLSNCQEEAQKNGSFLIFVLYLDLICILQLVGDVSGYLLCWIFRTLSPKCKLLIIGVQTRCVEGTI